MSRASHYRRTSKAAQRNGVAKAALPARDTDTVWIPEFVSSIQGLEEYFTADSIIAASLGATVEDRMTKLRELARRGILHMTAYREGDVFVEYRFILTDRGRL